MRYFLLCAVFLCACGAPDTCSEGKHEVMIADGGIICRGPQCKKWEIVYVGGTPYNVCTGGY